VSSLGALPGQVRVALTPCSPASSPARCVVEVVHNGDVSMAAERSDDFKRRAATLLPPLLPSTQQAQVHPPGEARHGLCGELPCIPEPLVVHQRSPRCLPAKFITHGEFCFNHLHRQLPCSLVNQFYYPDLRIHENEGSDFNFAFRHGSRQAVLTLMLAPTHPSSVLDLTLARAQSVASAGRARPRRRARCLAAHRIQKEGDGNQWFLPNAVSLVSSCVDPSEDVVSSSRNDFYCLCSLSAINRLPHQQIAELSMQLRDIIETTINVPLGLP
jgi:hypothetical protein